jgi:Flp pilus assembly pilin Flp
MVERSRVRKGERGATLVEYALVVALVAVVAVSAMTALQNRSKEKYEQTAEGITEVAGVVIVAPPDEVPDEVPDDDPDDAATPPAISTSCAGSGSNCSFSITGVPAGSTVSWTVDGAASGDGPTLSLNGKKNMTYTVVATIQPGGQTATTVVTCSDAPVDCTAS